MKKIFYPLLFMLLSFSACTEDDSTLATLDVSDIVIENLEEEYSVRSYVGVNLKDVIKPTVQTAYAADDLTYTWYLYKASAENIDYKVCFRPVAHLHQLFARFLHPEGDAGRQYGP